MHSFFNFSKNLFYRKPFNNCYDSSTRVLCNGFDNVILRACRNFWKTLWIDSANNAFINGIPQRKLTLHKSWFILTLMLVIFQLLQCACSLRKHLIFVIIHRNKIYSHKHFQKKDNVECNLYLCNFNHNLYNNINYNIDYKIQNYYYIKL